MGYKSHNLVETVFSGERLDVIEGGTALQSHHSKYSDLSRKIDSNGVSPIYIHCSFLALYRIILPCRIVNY